MKVAVVGATGRTGRLLVEELLRRGHEVRVLVRDPDRLADLGGRVETVTGESRDAAAVRALVTGADAVVSALGPSGKDGKDGKDGTVHQDTAAALAPAMAEHGVTASSASRAPASTRPGTASRRGTASSPG